MAMDTCPHNQVLLCILLFCRRNDRQLSSESANWFCHFAGTALTGRPWASTSMSSGTWIVRPSVVVSVCQRRTVRLVVSNGAATPTATPSPTPTTAPTAFPVTTPTPVPTALPTTGPGCLLLVKPGSVEQPAANITAAAVVSNILISYRLFINALRFQLLQTKTITRQSAYQPTLFFESSQASDGVS